MPLIKCPECNTEVSDRAPKCVKCGYPLKEEVALSFEVAEPPPKAPPVPQTHYSPYSADSDLFNTKRKIQNLWIWGVVFIAVVVFLIIGIVSHDDGYHYSQNNSGNYQGASNQQGSANITRQQYDKINVGMTYEQVRGIMGSSGKLDQEINVGHHIQTHYWWGNPLGTYVFVVFANGRVESKVQSGLGSGGSTQTNTSSGSGGQTQGQAQGGNDSRLVGKWSGETDGCWFITFGSNGNYHYAYGIYEEQGKWRTNGNKLTLIPNGGATSSANYSISKYGKGSPDFLEFGGCVYGKD